MLARTGKTLAEHQARTIESYANLTALSPGIPWLPVLQGWRADDYRSHAQQYADAGFDMRAAPRPATDENGPRQLDLPGAYS